MPYCFVPMCSHLSRKETCSFFRFPKDKNVFNKWKKMCRRQDRDPGPEDRVCSCHFEGGRKEAGPTIFAWTKEKQFRFKSPEKRRRKVYDDTEPQPGTSKQDDLPEPDPDYLLEAEEQTVPVESDAVKEAEIYFLQQENEKLKNLLDKGENRMSFKSISTVDSLVYQYTGLPTSSHFAVLLKLLSRFELNYYSGWNVHVLNLEDQVLMTLMKLRLNLLFFDLAFRFKISTTTVQNVVITILHALHEILFVGMMDKIPTKEKNYYFLPQCFSQFQNCRMVLDCTEVEVAIPHSLKDKKVVFSHYKQRHTFKVLIGIAPNATITFVSNAFPCSASDKAITRECGVLNSVSAGDLILANKGFLISDLCNQVGASLNIPPFLRSPQFTPDEVLATRRIARARIHVERAINGLKSFRILDFIMPAMREHISVIVQTCAALVNLQYSLLKDNEQCFLASTESDL